MAWPWLLPGVAALVTILVTVGWLSWTANRLDRLHHRVDVARGTLAAQLLRRLAPQPVYEAIWRCLHVISTVSAGLPFAQAACALLCMVLSTQDAWAKAYSPSAGR